MTPFPPAGRHRAIRPGASADRLALALALALLPTGVAQAQARPGGAPGTLAGTVGQRQTREEVSGSATPLRRIDTRLQSRVSTRLQTRIDRNYDGEPDAAGRIGEATDRAQRTAPPR